MRPEDEITAVETAEVMEGQTITTKASKDADSRAITLPDPFLGELEELEERYGKEVVAEAARAQLRVKFQAAVRSLLKANKSDEEISSVMASWKPGDKLGLGGDPQAMILKNFGNMTPEQRAQLIAQLSAIGAE